MNICSSGRVQRPGLLLQFFLVYKPIFVFSETPVNGGYSQWSTWGSCSQQCAGGTQQRSRSCTNPRPQNGGRNCNRLGPGTEKRICNSHSCQGKLFKSCFVHIPKPPGYTILLYSQTFTQQNEHCDWLILGHVPLIKFKCIPTGIQLASCCPHCAFICLFFLQESLNI